MNINFHKYQGTGNDFVMIDNRELKWSPLRDEVQKICDRRFGVGADGLILIENHPEYDFEMIYFNSDGSKSLCGNGSRCAIHFAHFLELIQDETTFLTTDGVHSGKVNGSAISFEIFDVNSIEAVEQDYFINTGSPHYVKFSDDLEEVNVMSEGRKYRYHKKFEPNGTNVNFVQVIGEQSIKVRTYERGVEAETLSCGTGVTAAALAASEVGTKSPVRIHTLGGELTIEFQKKEDRFTNIVLTGPAIRVFEGDIEI